VSHALAAGREDLAVLAAFRAGVRALGNDLHEEPLQGLVDALVPEAAPGALLFVVGNDGRLHLRTQALGHDARDVPVPTEPLSRDSSHPAALSVRECALVGLPAAGQEPEVWGRQERAPPRGVTFVSAALPLTRGHEAVGSLYLHRGEGRPWKRRDMELLDEAAERLSLALENLRLRREVQAAHRAKTDFLTVMNHELRTPLTAVVGYADLLEAGIPGPVSERQRVQLGRIKDSAWQLLELIEGILSYARYDGGEPDLQVTRLSPEELAREATALVSSAAEEKGLVLLLEPMKPLPLLPTDANKARRVLFHIVSNAVKFTREGGVRVRVGADPHWVIFSVADTGMGIRSEDRESIFEPFWQGESPETRTTGGAGMGLALAQRLTELLSGEIDVESQPGRGSTFVLRLPREGPHPTFP